MIDEDRLITRAAVGETGAFRLLYEHHKADVARIVYRLLGPRSDLGDVIEEVFVQVSRGLRDFRGPLKFSTWLRHLTVKVALACRSAAHGGPLVDDDDMADDASLRTRDAGPDDDVERRERVRAFGRLLGRLADKNRIVVVLHDLEGIAPAEISKIVGAPVVTVRLRLFRARRELEAMLADEPSLAKIQLTLQVHAL
jgi:RNA polymerase sigma-70 factor (ECF subfamily)